MQLKNPVLWATAVLTLIAAHACGGGGENTAAAGGFGNSANAGGKSGAAGSAGSAAASGTGGFGVDASQGKLTSLAIDPPSAVVDVSNGTSSPVSFAAIATYEGGVTSPVIATWSFDRADLGAVSQGGSLSAHGEKGGKGVLTASFDSMNATADVAVQLHFDENPANLAPAEIDRFKTPDQNPSVTISYPYDRTVFARGILAPELMWSGGALGDVYKIQILDQYVDLTTFVTADPASRWLMNASWWEALTESSQGAPVSVKVQRMDAAKVTHQPTSQTWRIAPGSLRGTIFYWEVNRGRILKINPGASSAVPAFEPGPPDQIGTPAPVSGYSGQAPPWDGNDSGRRCVACHTVSKDGTRLAASFSACNTAGVCARPWGVIDTASEQVLTVSNYAPAENIYQALSPNGSHLVYDTAKLKLGMADPVTAGLIPSSLDSVTGAAHPQFSPDGKVLAFAANISSGYPIEFPRSDLDVFDVDLTTPPYFTNRRQIQAGGADEIGFPSFSPDSNWIVYQRGDFSRASYGPGPILQTGHNDLYVADVAKQVGQIKLDQANGAGVLGPKDLRRNYNPRVNPIQVGGYFWVVFVSPRDYGNRMNSTTDSTNQNRKQLWVTAVDANPKPGVDPSHPAFWLVGQDLASVNMDGYWALEPCKQEGLACNEGYECCTGFCRDQGDGTFQCVPPPSNDCAVVGEACQTAADCCPTPGKPLECIGGFCAIPGPA